MLEWFISGGCHVQVLLADTDSNIKFHEKQSSASTVVLCGQMDSQSDRQKAIL